MKNLLSVMLIVFMAISFSGCAQMLTIHIDKEIGRPKDIKTSFKPVNAEGKETMRYDGKNRHESLVQ